MSQHQAEYLVIAGPTASGKSALALELAQIFRGEIINCDSVQLYRGFDIGSAKPSAAERALVPHHLLDVVDAQGKPRHSRGISTVPGLYFVGLPWLSRRSSSFIYGVWHDARFIAEQIAMRRGYEAYRPSA